MNVRDGSATLREALDSVVAQTFTDWEIILWDDRSTDDSASIVAEYQDPRIRYWLSPEATPLGRARNSAIRKATGEWLAFLDQDDIWLPDKLQKQVALSEDEPRAGIIYGRTLAFSKRGFDRDYDHRHEFKPLPEGDIFLQLFDDTSLISMSSAMLRRSAVEEIGGIPDAIQVICDYYLFIAVARRHRARAVQGVVCRYRLHSASMSRWNRRRMHEEALWLIDQWAPELGPALAARRRRVHASILALEDMSHLRTAPKGLARLVVLGSPGWLLSRPFALAFRAIRRRVRRPLYREGR
jgi:glycosyltransferase involved in cell wall biosynthesis